jgi:hypothetical protein
MNEMERIAMNYIIFVIVIIVVMGWFLLGAYTAIKWNIDFKKSKFTLYGLIFGGPFWWACLIYERISGCVDKFIERHVKSRLIRRSSDGGDSTDNR